MGMGASPTSTTELSPASHEPLNDYTKTCETAERRTPGVLSRACSVVTEVGGASFPGAIVDMRFRLGGTQDIDSLFSDRRSFQVDVGQRREARQQRDCGVIDAITSL